MSKTFEFKGVWHSSLVQASDPGGLLVRFSGGVRDSKYEGKPKYIKFEVSGDDSDYLLNIENGDIETYLTNHVPDNEWVMVFAAGCRESATVKVEDADGNPIIKGEGNFQDVAETPKMEERRDKPSLAGLFNTNLQHILGSVSDYGNCEDSVVLAAIIEAAYKFAVTEYLQK